MGESQSGRDAVGRMTARLRESGVPSEKAASVARDAIIRAERAQAGEKPPPGRYDISNRNKKD